MRFLIFGKNAAARTCALLWHGIAFAMNVAAVLVLFLSLLIGRVSVAHSAKPEPAEEAKKPQAVWNLDSNRTLTARETAELKKLVLVLADKKTTVQKRSAAVKEIGLHIGHVSALEPLSQVAADLDEDEHLRYEALTAISRIADKKIMPILIQFLSDPKLNIRCRANEQLWKLAQTNVGFDCHKDSKEDLAAETSKWQRWWEEHNETFVPNRDWVLVEF